MDNSSSLFGPGNNAVNMPIEKRETYRETYRLKIDLEAVGKIGPTKRTKQKR